LAEDILGLLEPLLTQKTENNNFAYKCLKCQLFHQNEIKSSKNVITSTNAVDDNDLSRLARANIHSLPWTQSHDRELQRQRCKNLQRLE
jgi:CxxC motif-containing protein